MKTIWRGLISFGLVNIPIKLYSATESGHPTFRLLCKKCKTPVHYKRTCSCQDNVPWEDIVKAIEIGKDTYRIIPEDELEKIKPQKTSTIDILEFIDARQIDPLHLNKKYFLGPEQEKEKAYFLLKEVLHTAAKVAIGQFVLRDKQHLCAIEPYQQGFLLTTLHYTAEVRKISDLPEVHAAPTLKQQELDLAQQLVQKLYVDHFEPEKFKDTFAEELHKILEKRDRGEEIMVEERPQPIAEDNLMEILKASIES